MRTKKSTFNKRIRLPIEPPPVPENVWSLIKSKRGKKILSLFSTEKTRILADRMIRRVLIEGHRAATVAQEYAWEASQGNVILAGIEAIYDAAIRELQRGGYGSVNLRQKEIEKDISRLRRRKVELSRMKESELIRETNRKMLAAQADALTTLFRELYKDHFPENYPAHGVHSLVAEILSNYYRIKLTNDDVKAFLDYQRKHPQA